MQDRPSAIELLEAAAQFIDRDIVPVTEGARQFQARVAANVMRIVAREIAIEESQLRDEVAALAALLRTEPQNAPSLSEMRETARELNDVLSEKIRSGEADSSAWRADVLRVVRKLVEEKLRVANPRYLEADLAARKQK